MTHTEASIDQDPGVPQTIEVRPNHPSQQLVTDFGAICFLAARSKMHRRFPVGGLSQWWDMPLALGQYWVFRHEGVPRAAISWAALSPEGKPRYILEIQRTGPESFDRRVLSVADIDRETLP